MSPIGLTEIRVGDNGTRISLTGVRVDVDLHTATDKFAPNEYRGVVNPSGLAVYKGSNTKVER